MPVLIGQIKQSLFWRIKAYESFSFKRFTQGRAQQYHVFDRAFLDGAGWSDAGIVDAAKEDIKACLGCFAYWHTTPEKCSLRTEWMKSSSK
jgi:hypothetical protein